MTRPTRRAVLAAPFALAAAACTGKGNSRQEPNPDAGVVRQAQDRERSLIVAYDAALAVTPADPVIRQVRSDHLAHLRALGGRPATAPLSPAPSSGSAGALDAVEDAAAAASQAAALAARSGATAQLLASIAASEASHVVLLGTDASPPSPK